MDPMRIALTLDRDADASESNDYLQSLLDAGVPREAIEVVTPLSAGVPQQFDALLLGGGGDVDPTRYGRSRLENGTVEVDAERDRIDFALFDEARRRGAPVLGICRGLQVVNVALGGTLVQDIPSERPSGVVHEREGRQDAPRPRRGGRAGHPAGRPVRRDRRSRSTAATTRRSRRSRPDLAVSGTAPDGLPEAVEGPGNGSWLVAVQWHPENLAAAGDPVSRRLFAEFARAAREAASRD